MSKYSSNGYYIDHKKLLRDLDEADKRKIEKTIKRENSLFEIEDERSRRLRNRSSSPTRKMRESPRRVRNRSSSPTRKMRESPRRIKYTENELRLMDELERCREEVRNLNQQKKDYKIGIQEQLKLIDKMQQPPPKRRGRQFVLEDEIPDEIPPPVRYSRSAATATTKRNKIPSPDIIPEVKPVRYSRSVAGHKF